MSSRSPDPVAGPLRVGRYLLVESVGEGGMGRVHRARAFGAAGVTKEVCIKRIRDERLASPGAAERFVGEARVGMQLVHGNIVPVFDFGRAGDEYFLAMEWIDGADLRSILRDLRARGERVPAEVAAHLAAEVARALAYAHTLDTPEGGAVVHRDVKPANVLVSRAGDVKLTDFGVATVVGRSGGSVGGTVEYMPPEQLGGGPVDGRADLYALGITLCEMLWGRRAVTEDEEGQPVPAELRALVTRLVAAEAAERPAAAREVALELEDLVGRARSAGADAPRDTLAALATRAAEAASRRETRAELSVNASFLRDGTEGGFAERMGATTATGSSRAEQGRDRAPPRLPHASRRWRWLALSASIVAIGTLAALFSVGDGSRPAAQPPPGTGGAVLSTRTVLGESDAAPRPDPPAIEVPTPRSSDAAPVNDDPQAEEPARQEAVVPSERPRSRRPARRPGRRAAAPRLGELGASSAGNAVEVLGRAHLDVNALPWAEVWIDGRRVGITPLFGLELEPGDHVLRFVNEPLGLERETRVTLEAGDDRDLVVDLR